MQEHERRLAAVLTAVAEHAVPTGRARNPELTGAPQPRRADRGRAVRRRTAWVVSAVGAAAVAVAVAVGTGLVPVRDEATLVAVRPSPSATWSPAVPAPTPTRPITDLPTGALGALPSPRLLDPLAPGLGVTVPTLVTDAGALRLSDPQIRAAVGLVRRPQGLFLATVDRDPQERDGLYRLRLWLNAKNLEVRPVVSIERASSFAVAPDGLTLAVVTWLGAGFSDADAGVVLVDLATGAVTHRHAGHYTSATWASNGTLLLGTDGGQSWVWAGPWSAPPVRAAFGGDAYALPIAGAVLADPTTGCLGRLDGRARELGSSCAGWRVDGSVSPGGSLLPVGWAAAGVERHGVLDVTTGAVSAWPVEGASPRWLDDDRVLLSTTTPGEDNPADRTQYAVCSVSTGQCQQVTQAVRDSPLLLGMQWLDAYR